jgi:SAM-dependent methyltransferase
MGGEASKTLRRHGDRLRVFLVGRGLDIGAGADPVLPDADCFDREHGDANHITRYVDDVYDWVFSSHCLEHMEEPQDALQEWFSLVRPGGHLLVIVPDEDLYEQGYQAGSLNVDHKSTFTISKATSWSHRSRNVLALVQELPGAELVRVELQDDGLDRRLLTHGPPPRSVLRTALALPARVVLRLLGARVEVRTRLRRWSGQTIDQTVLPDDRLAQIVFVVRKPAPR